VIREEVTKKERCKKRGGKEKRKGKGGERLDPRAMVG